VEKKRGVVCNSQLVDFGSNVGVYSLYCFAAAPAACILCRAAVRSSTILKYNCAQLNKILGETLLKLDSNG
jgi:hypothetical protein